MPLVSCSCLNSASRGHFSQAMACLSHIVSNMFPRFFTAKGSENKLARDARINVVLDCRAYSNKQKQSAYNSKYASHRADYTSAGQVFVLGEVVGLALARIAMEVKAFYLGGWYLNPNAVMTGAPHNSTALG